MKTTQSIIRYKWKATTPNEKKRESIIAFLGSVTATLCLVIWFGEKAIIHWGYYEAYSRLPRKITWVLETQAFISIYWWVIALLSVLVAVLVTKFAKSHKLLLWLTIPVWFMGAFIYIFLAFPHLTWLSVKPQPTEIVETQPVDKPRAEMVVIHTTDGRELKGQVVSETNGTIRLKMENGEITIDRKEIAGITTLNPKSPP